MNEPITMPLIVVCYKSYLIYAMKHKLSFCVQFIYEQGLLSIYSIIQIAAIASLQAGYDSIFT